MTRPRWLTVELEWIAPAAGCFSLGIAAWSLLYTMEYTIPLTHPSQPARMAADLKKALPGYRINKAVLDRFRALVEREYNRTGRYPPSRELNFIGIPTFFEDYPDLGNSEEYNLFGPGTVIYKSDGENYKLLLYNSGDCFVARALHPELRDLTRSAGFEDCVYYGHWSVLGAIL